MVTLSSAMEMAEPMLAECLDRCWDQFQHHVSDTYAQRDMTTFTSQVEHRII